MDDLTQRLERMRAGIGDDLTESEVASARAAVDARVRRDSRRRIATAMTAVFVPAAIAGWILLRGGDARAPAPESAEAIAPPATNTPSPPAPTPSPIVTRSEGAAHMRVIRDLPDRTEIGIDDGRVEFEVDLSAGKQLVVIAGDVAIQVHSPSFAVERNERGVGVWVHEGWVGVVRDGNTVLAEGDHVWLSQREPAPAEPPRERLRPPERSPDPPVTDWRDAARQGNFREAYATLTYGGGEIGDDVDDLLLAADAARMSGHADEALAPLERIARDHADDPRVPLAHYTLGRVYLHQLGQPRDAAAAFARARELGLDSSLAEDALARETEAWSRAGDDDRARARAEEYLRAYPDGHWARSVRSFGGVE